MTQWDPSARNAFFALLPPNSMNEYLSGSLRIFFAPAIALTTRTESLKRMFQHFSSFDWDTPKTEAFRQSPMAATSILLYFYMSASGHSKHAECTHRHGVPFTEWEPLPFLKKIYPDKKVLWNQMTIGLLQMPTAENDTDAQLQYQRVMGSMFHAFSQAFLPDGPSLAITQGIIESLGANPLDYFMDAHKKTGPVMDLALPDDMFSFS
jgi:hypothetical protein